MTKIHILGLPHTETTREYEWCAFTSKTRKFATMMHDQGYDVRLYSGEVNEAEVTEHIPVVTRAEQAEWFGNRYDWSRDVFNEFDPELPWWQTMNSRAIAAIRERAEPGDILAMTMGGSQKVIADAVGDLGVFPVETGIGYQGVWAPYRVYESYAWLHHVAGLTRDDDVKFYHTVIPNFFEPEALPLGEGKGDYYLFIGRFIRRKGVQIAVETTQRIGAKLVMAGQGVIARDGNSFQGIDLTVSGDHLSHVGVANVQQRAELMGNAKAVFVPTIYLEPFGGVHVEAMMCGTPIITTDYGAFTETFEHGVQGFRCNTLAEFADAALKVETLDRAAIREYAVAKFNMNVIGKRYDDYFKRLATLNGAGWYS